MVTRQIMQKIRTAPRNPGVYIFSGRNNKTIYIGKAADLKNRLASYLNPDNQRNHIIISNARDVDFIITESDVEALTLEESLIKLHTPRYNVRLKDDKKFPYLKITIHEPFPRIIFTRNIESDGSLIFGPYTSARSLRRSRDALCRIFKLVSCTKDLSKCYSRPCLEHNLGRCCAPCIGNISQEDYSVLVQKAITFLNGNSDELEKELEKVMWRHAEHENFEAAAMLRDQLVAIRRISQRQHIVSRARISRDVIGINRLRHACAACLMRIREQRLVGKEVFHMTLSKGVTNEEIAGAFIRLIYTHLSFIPRQIVIAHVPRDWDIQQKWFINKGHAVQLSTGQRGEPKRLLTWATRNIENDYAKHMCTERIPTVILELQEILQLDKPPRWIEAFDISNIGSKYAVGSSVAFRNGKPYKQRYRRYRIKRVAAQNDYAMINEIVMRRLNDLVRSSTIPDLMLIDGGPGQLTAAMNAFQTTKSPSIPVFALAKRKEELYDCYGRVVAIPTSSKSMYLLRRIRDEAHRFAITYHQKIRGKGLVMSLLDSLPSIGRSRKIKLLQYFRSVDVLKKASIEDISRVPGIGRKLARVIYEALHA